jgi:bifunctional non-homologous end joining protein LigD
VSTPVSWEELGPSLRPEALDIGGVLGRLAAGVTDPWRDIASVRQSITAGMLRDLGVEAVRGT